LFRSQDVVLVSAQNSVTPGGSATNDIAGIRYNGSRRSFEGISPTSPASAMYPFTPCVVAIPFSFINLAASATNECQLWDVAVAQGTPYIDMPWRGTVIGLSYRISGARTGGTFTVRARNGAGTSIYLSSGALGTGAALTGSFTQAINLAAGQFTSSTALGVDVVTNAAFAPTTLDFSGVLYVALDVQT
jgi:hypothetical protein